METPDSRNRLDLCLGALVVALLGCGQGSSRVPSQTNSGTTATVEIQHVKPYPTEPLVIPLPEKTEFDDSLECRRVYLQGWGGGYDEAAHGSIGIVDVELRGRESEAFYKGRIEGEKAGAEVWRKRTLEQKMELERLDLVLRRRNW
jgi:hypothetical protein